MGCNVAVDRSRERHRGPQTIDRPELWRVCKTVPYDWRMHKIQKAAVQSARRLTDLLTRPDGDGGDVRHRRTLTGALAWSARRAGTPETGEAYVVVLITQRSRVQIPPPLPSLQVRRPLPIMEGVFCVCRVHGIVHEAREEGRAAVAAGR